MVTGAITNSELHPRPRPEAEPKKASRQILIHELSEGLIALERTNSGLFVSGLSAGLDIGFSMFMMATVASATAGVYSVPTITLLTANMYAVGFLFVVLGRSELFTEQTTLAVLPVLNGKAGIGALARLWGIVLVANLCGAAAFAALAVLIGPSLGIIRPDIFGELAHRLIAPSMPTMFGSAVFAGWLMGLLSWLVAAARDTISQIVIVWIIATVIGLAGLHHAIVGSVEVLAGVFAAQHITWSDYGRFLSMSVVGNALGGSVFVALIKYGHIVREAAHTKKTTS